MLVANSKYCSLSQDATSRVFHLNLEHKTISLRFCELLAVREKVFSLEVASLFYEESCPHNFKILTLCNQQHLVLLTIEQVVDLRELLQQAFVSMGLFMLPRNQFIIEISRPSNGLTIGTAHYFLSSLKTDFKFPYPIHPYLWIL